MSNDPEEDAARQNYKRLFPDKTKSSDDEENAERLNPTPIFPGRKPLSDNQPSISSKEEGLEWVNGQYGTINIRGAFKILQEHPDGTVEFKEKKAFVDDLEHIQIKVKDPETDKTKLVPITDLWNKWIEKRRYPHGITFNPSHVGHFDGKYNLFKGYKLGIGKAGDVAPFIDFMREVICAGHEDNFNYLVALIADMFQRPHLKPGIAVVIRADEGVGKSFFVERLCALMSPYYFATSNPSYVFGDHNAQLKNVILLHLEEAVWAGSKKDESLLKDLITGPTIPINDKFIPLYPVPNHLHLFITGNPDWLVSAPFRARRIFALQASEDHIKDTEYFAKLDKWFYKEGGAEALLHFFLNHKSDINLRMAPITTEHIEQQKQSMSGVKEWAYNWVELGEWPYGEVKGDGHCFVIKSLLCHDYNNSPSGKRHQLNERQFGIKFLELFPLYVDQKKQFAENKRVKSVIRISTKGDSVQERNHDGKQADAYDIPPIAELRAIMELNFGGSNDWDDKKEWGIRYGNNKVDLKRAIVIHLDKNLDPNNTDKF